MQVKTQGESKSEKSISFCASRFYISDLLLALISTIPKHRVRGGFQLCPVSEPVCSCRRSVEVKAAVDVARTEVQSCSHSCIENQTWRADSESVQK